MPRGQIAEDIQQLINNHTEPVPTVVILPSKDLEYDPDKDPEMVRAKVGLQKLASTKNNKAKPACVPCKRAICMQRWCTVAPCPTRLPVAAPLELSHASAKPVLLCAFNSKCFRAKAKARRVRGTAAPRRP